MLRNDLEKGMFINSKYIANYNTNNWNTLNSG